MKKVVFLLFYLFILNAEKCLGQETFFWTTSATGERLPKGKNQYVVPTKDG